MSRGKVYITYENSMRANVTGVYANSKLAEKERYERGDLSVIDIFEIKGCNAEAYTCPLYITDCKHYKPHLETIRELISCLYNLDGCACGGLAHIVTDDNNIDDDDLQWVLEYCDREENKDRTERGLVKLICEELLKLSMPERVLLFSSYYSLAICDKNCDTCPINKGNLSEVLD